MKAALQLVALLFARVGLMLPAHSAEANEAASAAQAALIAASKVGVSSKLAIN